MTRASVSDALEFLGVILSLVAGWALAVVTVLVAAFGVDVAAMLGLALAYAIGGAL